MSTATEPLTTAEFEGRLEAGQFGPDFRGYLWGGEVVEVMARNFRHTFAVKRLARRLESLYPEDAWTVVQECPLALREGYRPEPDVMVLRGPESRFHRRRAAQPDEVELVAEVSDPTTKEDIGTKLREYAAAGIPAYLIAECNIGTIFTFHDPSPEGLTYRRPAILLPGMEVPIAAGRIVVDEVFIRESDG